MGQPLAAVILCAWIRRHVPYTEHFASHAKRPSVPPAEPVSPPQLYIPGLRSLRGERVAGLGSCSPPRPLQPLHPPRCSRPTF